MMQRVSIPRLRTTRLGWKVAIRSISTQAEHSTILEGPQSYKNPIAQQYHNEFTTYLADPKVPNTLLKKLVYSKIESLVEHSIGEEGVDVLGFVLKNFNKNRSDEQLPLQLSIKIFNSMHQHLLSMRPDFLEGIMRQLVANVHTLPDETLILVLDFIAGQQVKVEQFLHRLEFRINDEFMTKYIEFMKSQNKLTLDVFESMCKIRVNDSLIFALNGYVEKLYGNNLPPIHCYDDLERSLDRVQMLVCSVIESLDERSSSISALFTIFKLNEEFLQVSASCSSAVRGGEKLIRGLSSRFKEVLNSLRGQSEPDDALIEALMYAARGTDTNFCNALAEHILADPKYAQQIKVGAKIIDTSLTQESLESILKSEEMTEQMFEVVIQAVSKSHPHLSNFAFEFYRRNGLLPSAKVFKSMLDKAINDNDYKLAFKIFNDSTTYIQWPDYYNDLTISKTLNDLIQCVVLNIPIRESFPMFRKIKAQLQQQINVDSINALASAMLEANLVGDVLEMLKRELPNIKDERLRLPIDKPFGYKYLKLFNTLHTYAITNTFDKTVTNNWYLFTHLYKYFHIPEDRILPTLRFFCQHDRLNGALLIFNKMVDQHQLHGNHSFQPPSPEMYMYLLSEFGDKLYEEGVIQLHDWLKMDTNIPRVDLQLTNVIMNAYCNLQDVAKVRDLFIAASINDKVDEESAVIMIKAYTYNDLHYVEKFWDNLSKFDLIPNYDMYKQYLIAYSYYGKTERAFELVEKIDEYDLAVNEDLLLNLHNYCYIEDKQQEIKDWAKTNYATLWSNVVKSGLLVEATGYKPHEHFLVDGSIDEKPKLVE
ncbi:hypothetical protein KGF57_003946 [Candida theae]|uniref:Mitochondrial group I intron splicing factor CCM1 n=1 Tax=Candida theae TaxID=1198502 RepID=A0AAD5BC15_9ASCO|nr:uncharacterized protein KGF57_003946 [Candida theae]KAI5953737.1 hypothetical protein KGF57_003946 [Candida theae]